MGHLSYSNSYWSYSDFPLPQPKEIRGWLKLWWAADPQGKAGERREKRPTLRHECSTFRELALFATWLLYCVCIPSMPVYF